MTDYEDGEVEIVRTFMRASSPNSTRQENRIRELEELVDLERQARHKLERTNAELVDQINETNDQMEECAITNSQFSDAVKKRDQDINRLRREIEQLHIQIETGEQEGRRRNHQVIMDMRSEVEESNKGKSKIEKEKQTLLQELETAFTQLDLVTKTKSTLEGKLENTEVQLTRLRQNLEEQEKLARELGTSRANAIEENLTLNSSFKEVSSQVNHLRRNNTSLENQLEDTKRLLEEEIRAREIQQSTLNQLNSDNEQLKIKAEDDSDIIHRLQSQLSRLHGDLSMARSRADKEATERIEEVDELRRKSNAKLSELQEEADREKTKASSLEKIRQQLTRNIQELQNEVDNLTSDRDQLAHDVKILEGNLNELQGTVTELTNENISFKSTINRLNTENSKLRRNLEDEEIKTNNLTKENNSLKEESVDLKETIKTTMKDNQELVNIKTQLENDRLNLMTSLEETKEMLVDADRKNQAYNSMLQQMKVDMEQRLREKTEELETMRRNSQRTIEELTATVTELEQRYKTETNRLKKKLETVMSEMSDALAEKEAEVGKLSDELKDANNHAGELERQLEDERRENNLLGDKLVATERRRVQIQGDLEDTTRLLEAAEKARKNIQMEIDDMASKVAESAGHISSLANDKRRLEGEVLSLSADLEDAQTAKEESEDRASRLANEIGTIEDELRQAREEYRKAESVRKQLSNELKEIRHKSEERESHLAKEIIRINQTLTDRSRELESELEMERQRFRESQANLKKIERTVREATTQAEEDRRALIDIQQLLDASQAKIRAYRRQIDELESLSTENLNKYKRAQKLIDEAEYRAALAERRVMTTSTTSNSMNYSWATR